MAFVDAAAGALIGAAAGGLATYLAERSLDKKRSKSELALRERILRDEAAASREWQSRSAAVDIISVLHALTNEIAHLWMVTVRWMQHPDIDHADSAKYMLDRLKHAHTVNGPLLTVLALREQLAQVVLLASECAYGQWFRAADSDSVIPTTDREKIKRNRGETDVQNFVAWTITMFQAYVDGSWTTFTVEQRPILHRDDSDSWLQPDQRDDDGGPAPE